jgi:phosphate/sulfate permease
MGAGALVATGALATLGLLFVSGGNDVAVAARSVAVGTGALNPTASIVIAVVFEFAGAALASGSGLSSIAAHVAPVLSDNPKSSSCMCRQMLDARSDTASTISQLVVKELALTRSTLIPPLPLSPALSPLF